ncbi:MAG: LamG-like jellyroll fold domain-containing protein [Gemmataceae bacterium]
MDRERLDYLLNRYLDSALTPEERHELETRLLASSEARAAFWRQARWHALLRRFAEERWGEVFARPIQAPDDEPSTSTPSGSGWGGSIHWWRRWLAPLMFTVIVAAVSVSLLLYQGPDQNDAAVDNWLTPPEPTSQAIAVLVQTIDARWADSSAARSAGEPLTPGHLRLDSGLAMIEFASGASVVLEAPVDFEIISANEAYCHRGRLSAHVPPPASGFRVRGPGLELVDRGTAFGMAVGEAGTAEVHVFEGEVDLSSDMHPEPRSFTGGKSARLRAGTWQEHIADGTDFVTTQDFHHKASASLSRRITAWQSAASKFRHDPDLVAWYMFKPRTPQERTLRNEAPTATPETHGTLVGCQWTEGRWPGKQALDFKRPTDRVRLHIPGEFQAVTLMAWLRVDSLPNVLNSLLLTDGYDPGELHWQLHGKGHVIAGHAGARAGEGHNYDTSKLLGPEHFGRWLHLALVCDGKTGTVSHWLNGEMVQTLPLRTPPVFRFGTAELGNWKPIHPKTGFPIRNFNGRMDELLLYGRALSADEIRYHYQIGKPDAPLPMANEDG